MVRSVDAPRRMGASCSMTPWATAEASLLSASGSVVGGSGGGAISALEWAEVSCDGGGLDAAAAALGLFRLFRVGPIYKCMYRKGISDMPQGNR